MSGLSDEAINDLSINGLRVQYRLLREEARQLRAALSALRGKLVSIIDSNPHTPKELIQPLLDLFEEALFTEAEALSTAPALLLAEHEREVVEKYIDLAIGAILEHRSIAKAIRAKFGKEGKDVTNKA